MRRHFLGHCEGSHGWTHALLPGHGREEPGSERHRDPSGQRGVSAIPVLGLLNRTAVLRRSSVARFMLSIIIVIIIIITIMMMMMMMITLSTSPSECGPLSGTWILSSDPRGIRRAHAAPQNPRTMLTDLRASLGCCERSRNRQPAYGGLRHLLPRPPWADPARSGLDDSLPVPTCPR